MVRRGGTGRKNVLVFSGAAFRREPTMTAITNAFPVALSLDDGPGGGAGRGAGQRGGGRRPFPRGPPPAKKKGGVGGGGGRGGGGGAAEGGPPPAGGVARQRRHPAAGAEGADAIDPPLRSA